MRAEEELRVKPQHRILGELYRLTVFLAILKFIVLCALPSNMDKRKNDVCDEKSAAAQRSTNTCIIIFGRPWRT
jgi:F0F1-type ATP synthase membrane subunit b/b'